MVEAGEASEVGANVDSLIPGGLVAMGVTAGVPTASAAGVGAISGAGADATPSTIEAGTDPGIPETVTVPSGVAVGVGASGVAFGTLVFSVVDIGVDASSGVPEG